MIQRTNTLPGLLITKSVPAGLWDRWTGFQQAVGLMAQGQQRSLEPTGRVVSLRQPSEALQVRMHLGLFC